MNYDEAIARWGAARLDAWKKQQLERSRSSEWRTTEQRAEDAERFATPTDPARVYVDFKFEDEGSSCCDRDRASGAGPVLQGGVAVS